MIIRAIIVSYVQGTFNFFGTAFCFLRAMVFGRSEGDKVYPGSHCRMKGVIAVDLGATNIRVGVYENSQAAIDPIAVPTPGSPRNAGEIISLLSENIRSLVGSAGITEIEGIGISAAGPVDHGTESVVRPPNIPLETIPLVGPLEKEFGVPVKMINDCHAGILGEVYFGSLARENNAVYLTMSTGIGAGILAGGKILLGNKGNAGEVGHFFTDDRFNRICGCGFPGHWEAYASGKFLPEFFLQWCTDNGMNPTGAEVLSPGRVFSIIRENRKEFQGFLEDLGRINARGIADIVVAYEPEFLVFDGSVVRENTDLIIPFIESFADRFLPLPPMTVSSLGGWAPLLGASVIARGYDTLIGNFLPEQQPWKRVGKSQP
jgi:glucokinase